jgi:hypothetical protein
MIHIVTYLALLAGKVRMSGLVASGGGHILIIYATGFVAAKQSILILSSIQKQDVGTFVIWKESLVNGMATIPNPGSDT